MMLPKFEDLHPAFNGPNTYRVTNEEPELHRLLLQGHRIRKAASIASAGEIPLAVLLPRCKELVTVDHCYGSIGWAFLKAVLLAQNGPRRMKALLLEESFLNFQAACIEAWKLVPEAIRNASKINMAVSISAGDQAYWRKEWFFVSEQALELAFARLDKLTFVHGDVADIKDRGPFDCFYISNAHEHSNRFGACPKGDVFHSLLRDGGLLLGAVGEGSYVFPAPHWKRLKAIKGLRTTWTHQLFKKVPEPKATKVVQIAV